MRPFVSLALSLSLCPALATAQSSLDQAPIAPVTSVAAPSAAPDIAPPPRWATLDAVGGGARPGAWGALAWGGWPWFGARAHLGVLDRLAVHAGFDSALGFRWRPFVGVGVRFVDAAHFRLTGEPSIGWLAQRGTFTKLGPSVELRLRMTLPFGRWVPFVLLATQYALLPDRTTIDGAAGQRVEWSFRHELTFVGTLGLAVAITRSFGVELAVGWPWVDVPAFGLPAFSLGIHYGSAR